MKSLLTTAALGVALAFGSFASANAEDLLSIGGGMCRAGLTHCVGLGFPESACRANYNQAMASGVWPASAGYPAKKCFRTVVERTSYKKQR